MTVAAIDIGTNSMRLLILDDNGTEIVRRVEVTALGKGVDATGSFDPERMAETLDVMSDFGRTMRRIGVAKVSAVATSASRDAANGREFVAEVANRIGVTPQIIAGAREAALSFAGATVGRSTGNHLVIDIGGGSTEFVLGDVAPHTAVSIDMGAVRLTDRHLAARPALPAALADARRAVDEAFIDTPSDKEAVVIGVAGTFTSLVAIALDLDAYDRTKVDGAMLALDTVDSIVERLAAMSLLETARISSLDPKRAPVILAGAVIASRALTAVSASEVVVSEADLLDALACELLRS
jgi:exopolyphosphatase/guanosine-5'-triphosphate,3'-diphosphate pyrophosphatase